MAKSKYANEHQRRILPKQGVSPPSKTANDRMAEVTVKLPERLLDKLDRIVRRESGRIGKVGRSTVLRWILDQFEE